MKNTINSQEITEIEDRIQSFEARTKCELLLVVAKASDSYPGASWRFGVIAGLILTLITTHFFELVYTSLWPLINFVFILLMTWVGHFDFAKKFTLSLWETETECSQKAIECFHTLGTSQVSHKVTAMIFLSIFERKIEVLVDETLKRRLDQRDLEELVGIMQRRFPGNEMSQGIVESIQVLEEKILAAFQGPVSDANPDELSNTIRFI